MPKMSIEKMKKSAEEIAKKGAIMIVKVHKDEDERYGGLSGVRPADSYEKEKKMIAAELEKIILKHWLKVRK